MTLPMIGHERGVELRERAGIIRKHLTYARQRQREGYTFTEIADELRVSRQSVVDALYWSVLR